MDILLLCLPLALVTVACLVPHSEDISSTLKSFEFYFYHWVLCHFVKNKSMEVSYQLFIFYLYTVILIQSFSWINFITRSCAHTHTFVPVHGYVWKKCGAHKGAWPSYVVSWPWIFYHSWIRVRTLFQAMVSVSVGLVYD